MIMVIGGAFQGKKTYAKQWIADESRWADGADCTWQDLYSCGAVDHFHLFVKRFLEDPKLDTLPEKLAEKNPGLVLVSDELGYGVVPVESKDRAWREKTGRICTRLAAQSEEVHRVICGVGVVIKHA
ncbi:MAG: bifunctional adenosylcobinamide kinase/adenosylcobinamide-phosphate guanylyltransferase [Lachnospiraceae bacterium]|nr:bifunctional adenosylcobinamide kinase/adenosylcobinamide-phosphate guanylyltransferase [Lachnospiraceae bacterium]